MLRSLFGKINKYFRWTYRQTEGLRFYLAAITIAGTVRVLAGIGFIVVSKDIIDVSVGNVDGSIAKDAILLAALLVTELLLYAANAVLSTKAETVMKNSLRLKLFSHILHSPMYRRGGYHSGDIISRIEDDVRIVVSNITVSLPMILVTSVQLVAAFALFLVYDSRLAWVILVISPFFLVLGKLLGGKLKEISKVIREKESHAQARMQEGIQHGSLIRAIEAVESVKSGINGIQRNVYLETMRRISLTVSSRSLIMFGFGISYLVALVWGCVSLKNGTITFGVMAAFLQLVGQIQRPATGISKMFAGFIYSYASLERLMDIESTETEKVMPRQRLSGIPGIRFSDVSYRYPDGTGFVHKSFSYDFRPGSHTVLLGPTGSGKTTLIRLVLALISPTSGNISIYNDRDSVEVSTGTRVNISFVPQGNTLLSGTIRENLLLGNASASESDIALALHTAVADFVYELPDGLDTMCGERGVGLSEGQSQRIAVARGLLKPAGILLFDEINSSLDEETGRIMFGRIMENYGDRTIILITHRSEAVQFFGDVLKL